MAIDPVCGMEVDEAEAPSMTYEGKTYYFCSMGCKRSFEEDPEQYVSGMEDIEESDEEEQAA